MNSNQKRFEIKEVLNELGWDCIVLNEILKREAEAIDLSFGWKEVTEVVDERCSTFSE
ncbi:hypothetical protein D3C77_754070 [compost metagenome]